MRPRDLAPLILIISLAGTWVLLQSVEFGPGSGRQPAATFAATFPSPSLDVPPPAAPNAVVEPGAPELLVPMGADRILLRGQVVRLHLCPGGLVDGLTLVDGTAVRFPSQSADGVAYIAGPGDEVEVHGWKFPDRPMVHAGVLRGSKNHDQLEVDAPLP